MPDYIVALAKILQDNFAVEQCDDLAALLARSQSGPAGMMLNRRIRVGGYFDLNAPLLIYDARAATVGLVEVLTAQENALEAELQKAIDRAAAVRQIAIQAAERQKNGAAGPLPLQVEISLLVPGADEDPRHAKMATVLANIARQTGYLSLVGMSILRPEAAPGLTVPSVRRAFPWLLTATKKWFDGDQFKDHSDIWREPGQNFQLELQDYRLPGTLRFKSDAAVKLNVVHGHNGSGKSTLAEAVEMLLIGRARRVDEGGETDYFMAVRHRAQGVTDDELIKKPPAQISLSVDTIIPGTTNIRSRLEVAPNCIRRTAGAPAVLNTSSFRIDSAFMDKLAKSKPEGRAEIFLDAFSPDDIGLLPRLTTERAALRTRLDAIPADLRTGAPSDDAQLPDWILKTFAWTAKEPIRGQQNPTGTPGTPTLRSAITSLVPITQKETTLFARMQPRLTEHYTKLVSTSDGAGLASSAMGPFDEVLIELAESIPATIPNLQTALGILQEFGDWEAKGLVKRGVSFREDLDRWLELQALADLIGRQRDTSRIVFDGRQAGWEPDKVQADLLILDHIDDRRLASLQERAAELERQLADARARVHTWRESPEGILRGGSKAVATPRRQTLSPREITSLNKVGDWLDATAGTTSFGDAFQQAIMHDRPQTAGSVTIGEKNQLDAPIEELKSLLAGAQKLTGLGAPGTITVTARLQQARSIYEDAQRMQTQSTETAKSFFLRLAMNNSKILHQLTEAFNELLALMTPARWNYRDVVIRPATAGAKPTVGFGTEDYARADLIFNTAELNASALTLFLLLAPRLPNPLQVLILDDPLQNMDDLTVVTLARALARLLPIYPPGWLLLALFHGKSDVDHLREETLCRVYSLPWLQASTEEDVIREPQKQGVREVQKPDGLFRDLGPAK